MKTCPYCAEQIQDAAIKCRWCGSWLVDEIPAGAEGPPPGKAEPMKEAAESKEEKAKPAAEAEEQEAEEQKAEEAKPVPAQATMLASAPEAKQEPVATPAPAQAQPAAAAPAAVPEPRIEFTHTGSRYLLGYAPDHFGIWDRNAPQQPIERFPRNDEGWVAAWARYSQIETNWQDLRTGQKSS